MNLNPWKTINSYKKLTAVLDERVHKLQTLLELREQIDQTKDKLLELSKQREANLAGQLSSVLTQVAALMTERAEVNAAISGTLATPLIN